MSRTRNDPTARERQNPLLCVEDLAVEFRLKEGLVQAVNGVSFHVDHNESVGIVGESGCGKSITTKAVMRILPPKGVITSGRMLLDPPGGGPPLDLAKLPPHGPAIRAIRGADIAMIFQEPMVSLSPVHTIGNQIIESVRLHQKAGKREARDRAVEMLRLVGVPMAEQRVDAFPHELSGGLRQRCMIAMALACQPRLLIADEPTTALDVTIQAQILNLIRRLREELGMSVMMITHDLGVIAETTERVVVMYLGRIVESASVAEIFDNPKHPYTQGLLECIPRFGTGHEARLASIPGTVPDPFTQPAGCPFHPRCPHAIAGTCNTGAPPESIEVAPGHAVACVLYGSGKSKNEEDAA